MFSLVISRSPVLPNILPFARRSLGLIFLAFGIAGVLLPILPGWPFLVLSGRVLGRRDPLLRQMVLTGHRALRRLRDTRSPLLRRLGANLIPQWRKLARAWIG
ncbi:MAG TPA: hypothetical protein VFX76_09350 [Roseiflexaceae bacterium]|nr:hypothetical protein [Roseiflexaceae bacterium]